MNQNLSVDCQIAQYPRYCVEGPSQREPGGPFRQPQQGSWGTGPRDPRAIKKGQSRSKTVLSKGVLYCGAQGEKLPSIQKALRRS